MMNPFWFGAIDVEYTIPTVCAEVASVELYASFTVILFPVPLNAYTG
jgi:hypothetical protein